MGKSTHFIGQPAIKQLLNYLNKEKILKFSKDNGGERYVKTFNAWSHLTVMLYAIIMRFDSLREITAATLLECRKLAHLGIEELPKRSTLSDANARRSENIFRLIYEHLYLTYKDKLIADSQSESLPAWFKKLKCIDSTTVSLFSNLIFKGVGRNPKTGKKKGGIKVHAILDANAGVPSDIQFTSSAKHDHFMLAPDKFATGDITSMDRAYIDYEKFEEMTKRGIIYVTKMKKNLTYETISSVFHQNDKGQMVWREEIVIFRKKIKVQEEESEQKQEKVIEHKARIITYASEKNVGNKKHWEITRLLTNNFDFAYEDIVEIYRKRWQIESLFKQLKQNFPLRYFYGESANAIKVQIWITLIANLLLTLLKRNIKRSWSFSGLATLMRLTALYYLNIESFLEHPEKDWEKALEDALSHPPEPPEAETII